MNYKKLFLVMRQDVRMVSLLVLMPLAGVPMSAVAKANSDAATEWQEAALNYEYAAEAQQAAADMALSQSQVLRIAPAGEDADILRRGKIRSYNLDVRAADLLLAAAGNLDHAARTWHQAAAAAGRDSASYAFFTSASELATGKAATLLRMAVELCEQGAIGFAAMDDLLSQAAANQKAAGIREKLAIRR